MIKVDNINNITPYYDCYFLVFLNVYLQLFFCILFQTITMKKIKHRHPKINKNMIKHDYCVYIYNWPIVILINILTLVM